MTQCLVDFQAPVLRSLTTLSVEFLNASNAPTPLEWLENLSHLPSLTSLRLLNSMRSQGHSTPGTKQVELSLLSTLNLDASLHDTRIFIDGLKYPVSCGLIISCYECYPVPDLLILSTVSFRYYLLGLPEFNEFPSGYTSIHAPSFSAFNDFKSRLLDFSKIAKQCQCQSTL
jgi:hypothetical protein